MRRLILVTCLVGSFLFIGFTGGGEASTTGAQAAATTVPLKVIRARDGEVAAFAVLRIHGRRFPFQIDTGSSETLINVAVARALHLKTVGKVKVTGVGCSETAHKVRVSHWSIGGHALPKITALSSPLAGTKLPLSLLGADVLARFGAVRIDFAHGVMVLG